VGRLHEGKGLAALMRVWLILTKNYDAQLVLVGEGPENERIKQWCSESNTTDSVTLTGYQTNPAPYYRASDIFVFPSSSETFGNAIVEAMSHGLAVATTSVGVVKDWHRDAPVVRVDTNQLERFAKLLSGLIEDETRRSSMGAEAAEFIRGHYGVSAVCDNYQAQYRKILKKSG
jgi:glycosyltransferase involved in cell wall biosynthesis